MGGVASFKPFTIIIIITIILIASCIVAEDLDDDDNGGIATTSPTVSAAHSNHHGKKSEPLKPSTVVVVCVLTTVFSITFILLLYIKHCIGGNTFTLRNPTLSSSEERKNSGIDRAVVESLPVFRFGSLRGQKEGLDCAVCLTRFEDSEVLRLLPKCNHAFHVECVDTWLHAHSTCPLCRYKVDPEDVVILVDPTRHQSNDHNEPLGETETATENATTRIAKPEPDLRNLNGRISGRHSSAVVENENENEGEFLQNAEIASSLRRSYDSASRKIKGKRKDGMLLTQEKEHRLEHRIIVSPTIISQCGGGHQKRWSNVGPSDLLYLTSEMIISESPSSSTSTSQKQQNMRWPLLWNTRGGRRSVRGRNVDDELEKGGMTNLRSVSETTGLGRFMRNGNRNRGRDQGEEQRHEGAVSRWFAWISNTHPS